MKIYLSPHPDDVVLSCGGRLLKESESSLVINVFSKSYEYPTKWDKICGLGQKPMQKRIAEDRAVLKQVGAEAIYLNFFDDAVYKKNCRQRSQKEISMIVKKIKTSISYYSGAEIFCPVGINHPDHLLIASIGKQIGADYYYEDLPHALLVNVKGGCNYKIDKFIDRKIELISCYSTQRQGLTKLISAASFEDFLQKIKHYHYRNGSFFERFYLKDFFK